MQHTTPYEDVSYKTDICKQAANGSYRTMVRFLENTERECQAHYDREADTGYDNTGLGAEPTDEVSYTLPREINKRDTYKRTAVIVAACANNDDTLEALLQYSYSYYGHLASISAGDIDGMTATHFAVLRRSVDMIRTIVHYRRAYIYYNNDGLTPLHLAVRLNYVDCADALLRYRYFINVTDRAGDTALHMAVQIDDESRDEMVALLLKKGANLSRRNKNKDTPLHIAVRRNALSTVRLLVSKGADLTKLNASGQTPLEYARDLGHQEITELLDGAKVSTWHRVKAAYRRQTGNQVCERCGECLDQAQNTL